MKTFLIWMLLLNISFSCYAQLDSITQIHGLGCGGAIGQSYPIWVDTVAGATQYCFSIGNTTNSSILFDGQIGPYCSSNNQTMITFALAQPFYIICVTAYSANDSSNTYCDTIYSIVAPLFFSPDNDSLVSPNSSGLYSVLPFAGGGCEPVSFYWWITGDANINGINDSLQTVADTVSINFGPGFISSQLCVYGSTSFNLAGPHICMSINAPVGITLPDENAFHVNYDNVKKLISISIDSENKIEVIEIVDMQGKIVFDTRTFSYSAENILLISTMEYRKGVYILRIEGSEVSVSKKFVNY